MQSIFLGSRTFALCLRNNNKYCIMTHFNLLRSFRGIRLSTCPSRSALLLPHHHLRGARQHERRDCCDDGSEQHKSRLSRLQLGWAREVAGVVVVLLGLRRDADSWRTDGKEVRRKDHVAGRHHTLLAFKSPHTEVRCIRQLAGGGVSTCRAGLVSRRHFSIDSYTACTMGELLSNVLQIMINWWNL